MIHLLGIFLPKHQSRHLGEDAFAYCNSLARVVIGPKMRTIAKGAFYSSNVKEVFVKATTPPTVNDYLFSSKPIIHVYASALADYKASRWAEFGTLVGDLEDYEEMLTANEEVENDDVLNDKPVDGKCYDLMGRPVTRLQPGTIYIRNGRKFITAP